MAICMGEYCAHMDENSGKCTFSGNCIVRRYNLGNFATVTAAKESEVSAVETVSGAEPCVFNPFQRGNGCMLAGYTHDEIWAHTR